jgi:DNA-binding NtrC family response regulator
MAFFTAIERTLVESISGLVYCNPFLPIRIDLERTLLAGEFEHAEPVWSGGTLNPAERANVIRLQSIAEALCQSMLQRIEQGTKPTGKEALLYEDLVLYVLYYRHHPTFEQMIRQNKPARAESTFNALKFELNRHLTAPGIRQIADAEVAHLMACFFQIRCSFEQIFTTIVGASLPMARLRAAIWQSVFTHDMRRYRRSLFDKTGDYTTLVVGASGTGKELVARAIALSRYIPYDLGKHTFADARRTSFFPLNLSALSPTLIESELFGHRRGAFTGAVDDREGWLELCGPMGTVFLDEIGELDPAIQVKLLRVLQSRTFQRIGDTRELAFRGKIIAATNRDLDREIESGAFRRDFYYRLCADIIVTPSLREQIDGSENELRTLVRYIAQRLLPDEFEHLSDEVMANIARHLGADYDWPGNFRELEQCVRNVLIRGEYRRARSAVVAGDNWLERARSGEATADELLSAYCLHQYDLCGSYDGAARRVGLDRRTVRSRVARARQESSQSQAI